MIEIIFKRRPIRDFLKQYPSEKWKEIIPDVLEIGVLNLKNSFNTYLFSKEDFSNILFDLRNFNSNSKSSKPKKTHRQKDKFEQEKSDSSESHQNELNDINLDSEYSTQKMRKTTAQEEVYFPDETEMKYKNQNFKTRPRRPYYTTQEEIREQNRENQRNIAYAESKIRPQVLNDKMIHHALKNGEHVNNSSKQRTKNKGINYVINYDKNLQPESIQKFEKEQQQPMYYYSNMTNNNINQSNLEDTSQKEVRDENSNYNNYGNESEEGNDNNNYGEVSGYNNNNDLTEYYGSNFEYNDNPSAEIRNSPEVFRNNNQMNMNNNMVNQTPVLNSLNTVETANFNNENINNNNPTNRIGNYNCINNNSNFYMYNTKDPNMIEAQGNRSNNQVVQSLMMKKPQPQIQSSFLNQNNISSTSNILNNNQNILINDEKKNEEATSNYFPEGELSMCNLSQRTKMLFKKELGNWNPKDQDSKINNI